MKININDIVENTNSIAFCNNIRNLLLENKAEKTWLENEIELETSYQSTVQMWLRNKQNFINGNLIIEGVGIAKFNFTPHTFHILYYPQGDRIATGMNFDAISMEDAIHSWRANNPKAQLVNVSIASLKKW